MCHAKPSTSVFSMLLSFILKTHSRWLKNPQNRCFTSDI